MINYSYVTSFKSQLLREWLFELADFELAMENFSYVYKNEVYINENEYNQAFCIALEFSRRKNCVLEANEIADGDSEDSFTLSFDKKTRRIKKPIKFKTLKS
jgi:hypothetical protein